MLGPRRPVDAVERTGTFHCEGRRALRVAENGLQTAVTEGLRAPITDDDVNMIRRVVLRDSIATVNRTVAQPVWQRRFNLTRRSLGGFELSGVAVQSEDASRFEQVGAHHRGCDRLPFGSDRLRVPVGHQHTPHRCDGAVLGSPHVHLAQFVRHQLTVSTNSTRVTPGRGFPLPTDLLVNLSR